MNLIAILYTSILYPLVQLIEISFKLFDKLFSNTGISVIGVSLTVTLLCLPLYIVAEHWQQVERDLEAGMKNGVERIKTTFKGDEQYMILTTFYRQHHYHPMMALRSSFGLLIQIPFFMAAYSCLSSLPALQGQSFLFIRNMGVQDATFMIGSFPVNVLPIAMTVINIIAGAIYTKGFALKDKLQIYGMALIFLVILYNSPSGLVLYWTMNNVFSLVKNIFYKLKKPLWTLYWLMVASVILVCAYILFVYHGAASMQKKLCASAALVALIPVPAYIRFFNWLIEKPLEKISTSASLRHGLFASSALGLCLFFGLVIPSSIMSSSVQEFSNIDSYTSPNGFLFHSFWQSFGVFVLWTSCIYFLFREKIQTIIAFVFTAGLVAGLMNAYAFTGNYGSMDATLTFIGGISSPSGTFLIANTLAVLAVIAGMVFALKFGGKIVSYVNCILSFVFIVLSVINASTITKEYKEFERIAGERNSPLEQKSVYGLSKTGKNVMIFMLDRAESAYFGSLLADNPDFNRAFSGFTYYKNTASFNGHTLMASPALYGGYEYTPENINKRPDELLKDKHNESLLVIPRILTEKAGFDAVMSDTSWANYSYVADMSFTKGYDKIKGVSVMGRYSREFKKQFSDGIKTASLSSGIERNLVWVSIFRTAPAIFRPAIYSDGSWLASESSMDIDSAISGLSALYYLPELTEISNSEGCVNIITNDCTHASSVDMAELGLISREEMSRPNDMAYSVDCVAFRYLAKYFDFLREKGVYDNTKIIIVADHGIGGGPVVVENYNIPYVGNFFFKDGLNPLLMVKDFNSRGDIKTDMTFMTNADTPSIALEGIVNNPVNPFTGKPIVQDKANGIKATIDELFMPHHSKSDKVFTVSEKDWYIIRDNIFIDENWVNAE